MVRDHSEAFRLRLSTKMRTILLGDIIAAARTLLYVHRSLRFSLLKILIQQADAAHDYHKRMSKPHPVWGNGSLMARANAEPQIVEPFLSDIEYLGALEMVIGAIIARKSALGR